MRIEKARYDRFQALGERLSHPAALIDLGLDIAWPPIDTARRDATWDFGFSRLAGQAHQDWRESREEIRKAAEGGDIGQTPGSAAAEPSLEDTLRLLRSALPDAAVTALWAGASNRPGSTDGRDWLRLIADVCRERLREAARVHTRRGARPHRTRRHGAAGSPGDGARRGGQGRQPPLASCFRHGRHGRAGTRGHPDRSRSRVPLVPPRPEHPVRATHTGAVRSVQGDQQRFGYGEYHVFDVDHLIEAG